MKKINRVKEMQALIEEGKTENARRTQTVENLEFNKFLFITILFGLVFGLAFFLFIEEPFFLAGLIYLYVIYIFYDIGFFNIHDNKLDTRKEFEAQYIIQKLEKKGYIKVLRINDEIHQIKIFGEYLFVNNGMTASNKYVLETVEKMISKRVVDEWTKEAE